MIGKRIFYCWFGKGPKSDLNNECINSWKKICPDYEIIELNENNYDYTWSEYAIEGYTKGNWSAVSNAARLDIMRKESGFYLDTDVKLIKSLDELREYNGGFITEYDSGQPDSGVLGRGNVVPELYNTAFEQLEKGSVLHKILLKNIYKLYDIHGESVSTFDDGFTFLDQEYFPSAKTKFVNENTIGIHYFENTWVHNPIPVRDNFYPYQKVNVYAGKYQIYNDKDATVDILLKNIHIQWKGLKVLEKLNYFFNPKVIMIESEDFLAERINWDTKQSYNTIKTPNGLTIYYLD